MTRAIRVANFSGTLGDRFSALAEAVTNEPVDVVIGDYMAEITMSAVAARRPGNGRGTRDFYAGSFLRQVRPLLATIAGKKIKVVTNDAGVDTRRVALGQVAYARTGDKGANASLGVWTPAARAGAYPWLAGYLTGERLRDLLGLGADVAIERYEMPRLHGVSFVLRGYFGTSGSANLDLDQIGKSLGEFLRARHVDVPVAFLPARS